jgi:hypothetical protein
VSGVGGRSGWNGCCCKSECSHPFSFSEVTIFLFWRSSLPWIEAGVCGWMMALCPVKVLYCPVVVVDFFGFRSGRGCRQLPVGRPPPTRACGSRRPRANERGGLPKSYASGLTITTIGCHEITPVERKGGLIERKDKRKNWSGTVPFRRVDTNQFCQPIMLATPTNGINLLSGHTHSTNVSTTAGGWIPSLILSRSHSLICLTFSSFLLIRLQKSNS